MPYIIDAIILLVMLCLFFSLRFYVKKRLSKDALLADLTSEVRSLTAEFNRITDRDISLFEEHINEVKKIIAEAEEKTAQFKIVIEELVEKHSQLKKEQEKTESQKKELKEIQKEYGEMPLAQKIENLQKKGLTSAQIASKLKISVGETELIIAQQK